MSDGGSEANRQEGFPRVRGRRLRRSEGLRELVRETRLHPSDLILPLFAVPGEGIREPVRSMPGVDRTSVDELVQDAAAAREAGVGAVLLFGIPPEKDERGSGAWDEDGIVQGAVRAIRREVPDLVVITDVCLCEYTSHGHCGLLAKGTEERSGRGSTGSRAGGEGRRTGSQAGDEGRRTGSRAGGQGDPSASGADDERGRNGGVAEGERGAEVGGNVLNDATLPLLARTAVSHAWAGAHVVAPSDMMDGRVAAIRDALDREGRSDVGILSYAAKYASAFYGPFRDAADSAPAHGDRRGYQMDPPNAREAEREVRLDLQEGADMVMVKPALPYLDVIRRLRDTVDVPLAAYHVSGEYAAIVAAGERGWLDADAALLEATLAIRRAGADLVVSYAARRLALALHR